MKDSGDYISREAFLAEKRKQYCSDCDRRKGMKKGKIVFCYEIGEAPCRACAVDDLLNDVEDFPAADVRPVVFCKDCVHSNKWYKDRLICYLWNEHDGNAVFEDGFCNYGIKREEGQ